MLSRRRSLKTRRNVVDLTVRIERDEGQISISPTRTSPPLPSATSSRASTHKHLSDRKKKTPQLKPLDTQNGNTRQIVTPSSAHPLSANSTVDLGMHAFSVAPYEHEPMEILPYLFLGSEKNASSKSVLVQKNIGFIVNVGKECKNHFELDMSNHVMGNGSNNSSTTDISLESFPLSPLYNPLNLVSSHHGSRPHSAPLDVPIPSTRKRHSTSDIYDDEHLSISPPKARRPSPPRSSDIMSMTDRLTEELRIKTHVTPQPRVDSAPTQSYIEEHFEIPKYLKLPWSHNEENLVKYFESAFQFINEAREKKKGVLVHCKQGLSRSATLVIAYIMKTEKKTMDEAYALVKSISPNVSPNLALVYQLQDYEQRLATVPE